MVAAARQSRAAAATLKAMRAAKRLEPTDDALVALVVGLAAAVDANSDSPGLWREYGAAVRELRAVGADKAEDDGQAAFLELVRPAVGDKATAGKKDVRAADRGGRKESRPAADAMAESGGGGRRRTSS